MTTFDEAVVAVRIQREMLSKEAAAAALVLARQFVDLTANARTNYLTATALEVREALDAKLREAGL